MTAKRAAVGAAALLAMVGIAATGCGGDKSADMPTTAAVAQPWDPCTLSDEALRRAGLDPATEGPGLSADPPGSKSCGWEAEDFDVIMTASTTLPVEDIRNGIGNIDFQDVEVPDRSAFTYREESDEPGTFCWLVVPFQDGGLVVTQVARSPLTKDTTPMCEWAVRVGEALVAEIPR